MPAWVWRDVRSGFLSFLQLWSAFVVDLSLCWILGLLLLGVTRRKRQMPGESDRCLAPLQGSKNTTKPGTTTANPIRTNEAPRIKRTQILLGVPSTHPPCAYSCSAHVRPCAQGRCGRCPFGFGVMSEFFSFYYFFYICVHRPPSRIAAHPRADVPNSGPGPVALSIDPASSHRRQEGRVPTRVRSCRGGSCPTRMRACRAD